MINENCDGRHSFVAFLCYKMEPPPGLVSILSELQEMRCYGDVWYAGCTAIVKLLITVLVTSLLTLTEFLRQWNNVHHSR